MTHTLLIITIPIGYIVFCYFLIKIIGNWTRDLNHYLRQIILSFLYALFLGIGIAGSDAEPGFGLPAPNIIAILLMIRDRFYQGVITGLLILCFWWILIFLFMLVIHSYRKKKLIDT